MANRIQEYTYRFQSVYDGEPWFGESIQAKLARIHADDAFKRPLPGLHSVAELVSHMVYWRQSLTKRLEGEVTYTGSMKSDDNWIPIDKLKRSGWEHLLERLAASQQVIASKLPQQPESFLTSEYRHGVTMDQLIGGIIDHDIYHLGQLALVMKALGIP